jgi:hypothetical protein
MTDLVTNPAMALLKKDYDVSSHREINLAIARHPMLDGRRA